MGESFELYFDRNLINVIPQFLEIVLLYTVYLDRSQCKIEEKVHFVWFKRHFRQKLGKIRSQQK